MLYPDEISLGFTRIPVCVCVHIQSYLGVFFRIPTAKWRNHIGRCYCSLLSQRNETESNTCCTNKFVQNFQTIQFHTSNMMKFRTQEILFSLLFSRSAFLQSFFLFVQSIACWRFSLKSEWKVFVCLCMRKSQDKEAAKFRLFGPFFRMCLPLRYSRTFTALLNKEQEENKNK